MLFWEEMEGQNDAGIEGQIVDERGHTFQMNAIALLPEGGKESSIILSDFIIARGRLD